MKINELQPGHYYVCYNTWESGVDTTEVDIIKYGSAEKTEYDDYNVYGEIIACWLTGVSLNYKCVMVHPTTEFKEITEEQYSEILKKYKALYLATQKLMQ